MSRVVVTGLGIVSCLGNDKASVTASLREGRSGIRHMQEYADLGLRSHVAGVPDIDLDAVIDRKTKRFMGDAAAYAYVAMRAAIEDAGLQADDVSNAGTGLIVGSGGGSVGNQIVMADTLRSNGVRRVGPYAVSRTMCSTVSACLAVPFRIKGLNYSISSACATAAHCIGAAMEQIQLGKQDVVFAGGADELHWGMTGMFDAMGALSTRRNSTPTCASRPFDTGRDGFVIAGGAGILVLENLDHAVARGARIYAEIVGYGASSDGYDMVSPSGEGAIRCMQKALSTVEGPVDYLNTHGTSTAAGDIAELEAIRSVFGPAAPALSSTKSMSGHSLGAAGAHEAIYCILMMEGGFMAPSINIEVLDPAAGDLDVVRTTRAASLQRVMSNSFGFGGTNATLVFQRHGG